MNASDSINRPTVRNRWRGAVLCVALTAAILGVYAQVLRFDFVMYDDPQFVTENHLGRGGLTAQGIAGAFSGRGADYWRPVSFLSHMLDCDMSRMLAAAQAAVGALAAGEPEECVAVELQAGLTALGGMLGEDVSEAVLDRIFADFCIGK